MLCRLYPAQAAKNTSDIRTVSSLYSHPSTARKANAREAVTPVRGMMMAHKTNNPGPGMKGYQMLA
jgi:hypothetical protein